MSLNEDFLHGMGLYLDGVAVRYMRSVKFASNPHNSTYTLGGGIYNFSLERNGNEIDVTRVPQGGGDSFTAYWCPNSVGKSKSVQLGNEAAIFFTPALTGCVLEIDGNMITHHDGVAPRRDQVEQSLTRGKKDGHRCWMAIGYYTSVVVGARLAGRWRFFQQSYDGNETAPFGPDRTSEI